MNKSIHLHHILSSPEHYCSPSRDSVLMPTASQVSTPSMKAMIPLAMDELQHHLHHSSSTESAQDQMELMDSSRGGTATTLDITTPTRKRPSKIPLPGTKGYLAPKPPTGRVQTGSAGATTPRISPSGPASNRSLSKSTGSLIGRSGPSSVTKKDLSPSMNRPESAQSLRKDSSLSNCSRSSSIPVSSKQLLTTTPTSTTRLTNSPLPKPKRESLTSRVRNMDSLTRIQTTATSSSPSYASSTTTLYKSSSKKDLNSSNNTLYKSTSKKDLSSSFSTGQTRDRKQSAVSVRRVSSASVGRVTSNNGGGNGGTAATVTSGIDISSSVSAASDNEKVPNFRTRLWNMLKI